jgi:CRP-like cAMP-binding protein
MPNPSIGVHDTRNIQALHFCRDDAIYFEGDFAPAWFAVSEGVVRTCRYKENGNRQILGFYYPGDVFGLEPTARRETAEAVTDAVVRCPAQEGHGQRDASDVESALRRALGAAYENIAILGRRTAQERVAAFILATAAEVGRSEEFSFPMSRSDMADYLGLTIHTVSRTIGQLCDQQLISLRGARHCRILDIARLKALAGEGH